MAGVRSTHLLIFTQQFAAMIGSSLQLVDVLDNLAKETPQKQLRQVLETITTSVRRGVDLADALASHRRVFNDIYINVVRAGMASGKLGDALDQIARYLKAENDVRRRVKSALTYPIFMIGGFFMVFNGMIFFILPRFSKMFLDFGKDLPFATQLLIDIGDFWKAYWYLIIGGVALLGFLFGVWIATADGREIWDRYKLKLPVIGGIWRMAALSRFLRTLSVQVHNEVMLLEAILLSADASNNVYIRQSLYGIADRIERGESLSEAFRRESVFHGIVLQMITAGEEAGRLHELLLSSADYFENLLHDRLDTVTNLINPILTLVIGLAVAGMMIASFMPVFQSGGAFM
ncbi:MAG: type II secretion system F family protein [Magnetovibrionaceae bacterium]